LSASVRKNKIGSDVTINNDVSLRSALADQMQRDLDALRGGNRAPASRDGKVARRRCAFRQRDLTRALKAAEAAGVDLALRRIEIGPDGAIRLVPARSDDGPQDEPQRDREIVL
jgi:hypothetical protein